MVKRMVKVMFPESFIALQRECSHHPKLLAELSKCDMTDWGEMLSCICTYVNLPVDGVFNEEDQLALYDKLYKMLKEKARAPSLILPAHIDNAPLDNEKEIKKIVDKEVARDKGDKGKDADADDTPPKIIH